MTEYRPNSVAFHCKQVIGTDTAVEQLLRDERVQSLPQTQQQRILQIVGASGLLKISFTNMTYLTAKFLVPCASDRLTSLQIVGCDNVDWHKHCLFGTISGGAKNLQKLQIENANTLRHAAHTGGTIVTKFKTAEFQNLRLLTIKGCPVLIGIDVNVSHVNGCLLSVADCPLLEAINVQGNPIRTITSVVACPKLPDCRRNTSEGLLSSRAPWDLIGSALMSSVKFGDTTELIKASTALVDTTGNVRGGNHMHHC